MKVSNVKKWCRTVKKMVNYRLENSFLYLKEDCEISLQMIECNLAEDDIVLVTRIELFDNPLYFDRIDLTKEFNYYKLPKSFLENERALLNFINEYCDRLIERVIVAAPALKKENSSLQKEKKVLLKKLEEMDIYQLSLLVNDFNNLSDNKKGEK